MPTKKNIELNPDTPAEPEVAHWAARVRPHLARTAESIIAAGRELIDAKAALPHGQFGPLLDELGMSRHMAGRFMRVAANPVLANAAPVHGLPASVSVLDELTRWDDDELAEAIDSGTIGPSTTRDQAREVRQPKPAWPGQAADQSQRDSAQPQTVVVQTEVISEPPFNVPIQVEVISESEVIRPRVVISETSEVLDELHRTGKLTEEQLVHLRHGRAAFDPNTSISRLFGSSPPGNYRPSCKPAASESARPRWLNSSVT